jgi:hypothetical protein
MKYLCARYLGLCARGIFGSVGVRAVLCVCVEDGNRPGRVHAPCFQIGLVIMTMARLCIVLLKRGAMCECRWSARGSISGAAEVRACSQRVYLN